MLLVKFDLILEHFHLYRTRHITNRSFVGTKAFDRISRRLAAKLAYQAVVHFLTLPHFIKIVDYFETKLFLELNFQICYIYGWRFGRIGVQQFIQVRVAENENIRVSFSIYIKLVYI